MRKKNKAVIQAISLGLAAMIALNPVAVYASESGEDQPGSDSNPDSNGSTEAPSTATSNNAQISNVITADVQDIKETIEDIKGLVNSPVVISDVDNNATVKEANEDLYTATKEIESEESKDAVVVIENYLDTAAKTVDDADTTLISEYKGADTAYENAVEDVNQKAESLVDSINVIETIQNDESADTSESTDETTEVKTNIKDYVDEADKEFNESAQAVKDATTVAGVTEAYDNAVEAATKANDAVEAATAKYEAAKEEYDSAVTKAAEAAKVAADALAAYNAAIDSASGDLAKAKAELEAANADAEALKDAADKAKSKYESAYESAQEIKDLLEIQEKYNNISTDKNNPTEINGKYYYLSGNASSKEYKALIEIGENGNEKAKFANCWKLDDEIFRKIMLDYLLPEQHPEVDISTVRFDSFANNGIKGYNYLNATENSYIRVIYTDKDSGKEAYLYYNYRNGEEKAGQSALSAMYIYETDAIEIKTKLDKSGNEVKLTDDELKNVVNDMFSDTNVAGEYIVAEADRVGEVSAKDTVEQTNDGGAIITTVNEADKEVSYEYSEKDKTVVKTVKDAVTKTTYTGKSLTGEATNEISAKAVMAQIKAEIGEDKEAVILNENNELVTLTEENVLEYVTTDSTTDKSNYTYKTQFEIKISLSDNAEIHLGDYIKGNNKDYAQNALNALVEAYVYKLASDLDYKNVSTTNNGYSLNDRGYLGSLNLVAHDFTVSNPTSTITYTFTFGSTNYNDIDSSLSDKAIENALIEDLGNLANGTSYLNDAKTVADGLVKVDKWFDFTLKKKDLMDSIDFKGTTLSYETSADIIDLTEVSSYKLINYSLNYMTKADETLSDLKTTWNAEKVETREARSNQPYFDFTDKGDLSRVFAANNYNDYNNHANETAKYKAYTEIEKKAADAADEAQKAAEKVESIKDQLKKLKDNKYAEFGDLTSEEAENTIKDNLTKELKEKLTQAEKDLKEAQDKNDKLQEKLAELEATIDAEIARVTPVAPTVTPGVPSFPFTLPNVGDTDADEDVAAATTGDVATLATTATVTALPTATVATPATGVAGVRVAANTGAVVTIDDEETPLAATIEDAEGEEAIKDKNTQKIDKIDELVTIEDEATPLAASIPADEKAKMNWWWLLLVAILGGTGYEMYKKHQEKKEQEVKIDN